MLADRAGVSLSAYAFRNRSECPLNRQRRHHRVRSTLYHAGAVPQLTASIRQFLSRSCPPVNCHTAIASRSIAVGVREANHGERCLRKSSTQCSHILLACHHGRWRMVQYMQAYFLGFRCKTTFVIPVLYCRRRAAAHRILTGTRRSRTQLMYRWWDATSSRTWSGYEPRTRRPL